MIMKPSLHVAIYRHIQLLILYRVLMDNSHENALTCTIILIGDTMKYEFTGHIAQEFLIGSL